MGQEDAYAFGEEYYTEEIVKQEARCTECMEWSTVINTPACPGDELWWGGPIWKDGDGLHCPKCGEVCQVEFQCEIREVED